MAEFDAGIGNLEQFITLVDETSTRLTADTGALEGQAKTLDGLESNAQSAWDDLGGRLDELQARLEDERTQATEAVGAVADLGGELADDRIPGAQDAMDERGRSIEEASAWGGGGLGAGGPISRRMASTPPPRRSRACPPTPKA